MLCLLVVSLFFVVIHGYPIPKISMEQIWDTQVLPYAHVCTISELHDGRMIAAFQGGKNEGSKDCAIYHSIRNGVGNWTLPTKAIDMDACTMNPSLYQDFDTGALHLMYHYNGGSEGRCSTHHWKGYRAVSVNAGETFINITKQPDGILGSVKNQCIKLSNGRIICPSSTEATLEVGVWMSHFEFTDPSFSTWTKTDNIHFFHSDETRKWCQGIIQPAIFEYGNGNVRAMFRSSCGVLATAVSTDWGSTWPYWATATDVPNPGAGIDVAKMDGTDLGALLAYNNNEHHRTPLSLGYSLDDGESWTHLVDVETDPNGSFAYPFIIQSRFDPMKAYMCYTRDDNGLATLGFVEFDWN